MLALPFPEAGQRVLVVTAHPDDVDFGMAATIALLTQNGVEVTYCITTDGNQGGSDPSISSDQLAQIRRNEQIAAAKVVGVNQVDFLGEPDGQVVVDLELRKKMVAEIRKVRPQVVIAQSPERIWERIYASHPDHLATGEAIVQAIYPDARNPFAFPELLEQGLEPWTVEQLWLVTYPSPSNFVDVTESLDKKLQALACHKSQGADSPETQERVRTWLSAVADNAGLPTGSSAEAFFVVNTT